MTQIYRYIDVMITHYKMAGDHNVHVSIDLGHTVPGCTEGESHLMEPAVEWGRQDTPWQRIFEVNQNLIPS